MWGGQKQHGGAFPAPSGLLRVFQVGASSRPVYRRILEKFEEWLLKNKLKITTVVELDRAMECYYEWVHVTGQPTSWAKQLKAAVVLKFPHVKSALTCSSAAMRGFFHLHESAIYPPVAPHLVLASSMWLWIRGRAAESLALLVSFTCCLRIGAVCSLMWQHVVLVGDFHGGTAAARVSTLTIPRAKNGSDLVFPIDQPLVVALLRRLRGRAERRRVGRVWP